MKSRSKSPIFFAIMAAICYGISIPISKILLNKIPAAQMAALLYFGAGIGMLIVNLFERKNKKEANITKKELPYVMGMIILDTVAPILLMLGLGMSTPSNVALLSNFEIVATALIALLIFKETIGRRMWIAIILITISSMLLSIDSSSISLSLGSILVLLGCLCWGLENNCTRVLSSKDPIKIVVIKGFGAGTASLLIVIFTKSISYNIVYIACTLVLGFFAYGLSIFFYIKAQRYLGAARTSAYYAIAPFVGMALSIIFFRQPLTIIFIVALIIMVVGAYLTTLEQHSHKHIHVPLEHEHRHTHDDSHHTHEHEEDGEKEHSHYHVHATIEHSHHHTPDIHHYHGHKKKDD